MRSLATIVSLLFAASAAAAQSPSPAKSASPPHVGADTARLGTYDLEVTTDAGTLTGSMTVRRGAEGLGVDLTVGPNKPAIKSFVREGDHYLLSGGHGTYSVLYTLKFSNDSVGGSFKMSGGLEGTVLGAMRK